MNIIIQELRKLLDWKMLLLIGVISFIFYRLFISFGIEVFPNGRPALDFYNISVEMQQNYGNSMNEQEFEDFKKAYHEDIKKANHYLQSKEAFVDAGVTTYKEFRNMDPDREKLGKMHDKVMFEDEVDVFWELQARGYLIERYEENGHIMDIYHAHSPPNESLKKRLSEIVDNGSIFPGGVFRNYNTFIIYTTILVLLSLMIVISPIYLKDKRNQLIYLQYASKTGRNLFKKKLVAGLCSAFVITTLQLAWLFTLYSQNHTGMFFTTNINSVFNPTLFWFDLTFIQYITLTVIVIYILGFVMTMIVAVLSNIVPNFITVIGAQVPIAFITFWSLFDYLIGRLTRTDLPIYFVPVTYAILIALAILLIAVRWRREKTIDIA